MHHSAAAAAREFARRLAEGDDSVLDQIMRVYGPAVGRSLARRYRGALCHEDIEDVLMFALDRLWRRRPYFDPEKGSLARWFSAMASDAAVQLVKSPWIKARRRERPIASCDLTAFAPRADDTEASLTASSGNDHAVYELQAALARLPPLQQAILRADANSPEGCVSASQLAKELGVKPATIRGNRRRGLRRLRALLTARGFAVPAAASRVPIAGASPSERERERERDVISCTVKRPCWIYI